MEQQPALWRQRSSRGRVSSKLSTTWSRVGIVTWLVYPPPYRRWRPQMGSKREPPPRRVDESEIVRPLEEHERDYGPFDVDVVPSPCRDPDEVVELPSATERRPAETPSWQEISQVLPRRKPS